MPLKYNPLTGKFDYYEPGVSGDIETRIGALEDTYIKIAYYAEITATSGQISPPAGAEILLDQWANGIDAILSAIIGTKPDFKDTGIDVVSFDTAGNYVLSSGIPSNPAALIYYFRIKTKDQGNLNTDNIIEYAELIPDGGIKTIQEGSNITVDNTDPANPIVNTKRVIYQAYDTVGGQDINQITPVPITLPTVTINSSGYFTFISTTRIRIDVGGLYNISYKIAGGDNVTSRRDIGGGIRINGTSILEQSVSQDYVRNTNDNEFAVVCPPYAHIFAAGTILELVGFRLGDAGQALTILGYSWMKLEFINI